MDYKKMFDDVIDTLGEALEELQTQHENLTDELNEAVKNGELKDQIQAIMSCSESYGKMKMINDIRCLMTEMKGEGNDNC